MSCTQKQQLVCFPKVRVYKPWFRHFNDHKDFRNEGTVHLFSLMALFSYANFRSNERVINGDRYTLRRLVAIEPRYSDVYRDDHLEERAFPLAAADA